MDTNVVLLTGTMVSVTERPVGQQGRTLVELRLAVTRPGRKGEGEAQTVVPVTIWAGDVGAAVRDLPEGTPLTVVGRISAREWTAPSGQARTFVEVVAETVTVDVVVGPVEAAPPARVAAPAARPVSRAGPRESATDVPF